MAVASLVFAGAQFMGTASDDTIPFMVPTEDVSDSLSASLSTAFPIETVNEQLNEDGHVVVVGMDLYILSTRVSNALTFVMEETAVLFALAFWMFVATLVATLIYRCHCESRVTTTKPHIVQIITSG